MLLLLWHVFGSNSSILFSASSATPMFDHDSLALPQTCISYPQQSVVHAQGRGGTGQMGHRGGHVPSLMKHVGTSSCSRLYGIAPPGFTEVAALHHHHQNIYIYKHASKYISDREQDAHSSSLFTYHLRTKVSVLCRCHESDLKKLSNQKINTSFKLRASRAAAVFNVCKTEELHRKVQLS